MSQIWSITPLSPRSVSFFSKKSTPIVCAYTFWNPSFTNLAMIEDLPTEPSPMSNTLQVSAMPARPQSSQEGTF